VTPGVPAQPAAAAPVAAAAPPAPRAVVEPVPRIAQTPTNSDPVAPSTADPVPASPPPEGGVRAPAAAPAPTSPPSRLTLDVLVYSDDPVGRLVFINGKKYLEGQTVEGDTIVEQITQEGAVLRQGGQRIVLRPKLNPYSRPTSP
jgi:general secretion pathway protein B